MRIKILIIVSLAFSASANAEDPMWFVSVYGENMQLISGASADRNVKDGVFLSTEFVGPTVYVRVKKGYELDGFRPHDSGTSSDSAVSASESAVSMAQASEPEEQSMAEFGPLSDTGVQYYVNGDFFGWYCARMYVQPLGDRVYRLRCNDNMEHGN